MIGPGPSRASAGASQYSRTGRRPCSARNTRDCQTHSLSRHAPGSIAALRFLPPPQVYSIANIAQSGDLAIDLTARRIPNRAMRDWGRRRTPRHRERFARTAQSLATPAPVMPSGKVRRRVERGSAHRMRICFRGSPATHSDRSVGADTSALSGPERARFSWR